ncbi:HD domain-containing protein [Polynucleobacter meluiroseus]|uniref:HD domain-containing protein n=1 Tax=Polynucleobacter meluiroseus TaxID=1938814 RepID=A0A240E1H4_9BURK|nr:HD domain-containing phosphohydrolase [Polynucleobacter meluiroseus]SNX29289.1 HD domain-containing protein [Polynucleobacter meluiroseus]
MQYSNEIFFAIAALMMWGLAVGSYPLIQARTITKPEGFWYAGLLLEAASFTFFASASIIHLKLLTLANISLLAGYIYLATYLRSLSQPVSRQFQWIVLLALLIIGLSFESLLQFGSFMQRVGFVIAIADLCLAWQLWELRRLHKSGIGLPVFLIITIIAQFILATARSIVLIYVDPPSTFHIYQEPPFTVAVRWAWFAFMILSYVAMIGYRINRLSAQRLQTQLENNRLKVELAHQRANQIESQLLASLNALAKARDNETGNHIIRTQNYVKNLALGLRKLGHYTDELSDEAIALLFKAAPLHDIGKVGIPDNILLKQGRLNAEEWEIMKTHASIGETVLTTVEHELDGNEGVIIKASKIAGGHHEKWDGTGYPRGLKGTDIPLPARIMALADVYDALVSERIYKAGWSHEDAMNEIVSKKGSHFDPLVVDAFVLEADSFLAISRQYEDS